MFSHPHPFDPTYGYDEPALRRVPAPDGPDDFADFWRQTYRQARAVPLRLERREIAWRDQGVRAFEVEFDSPDGVRVGAWLTVPRASTPRRGLVNGHGYGGREGPDTNPLPVPTARLFPCARGFNRSANPRFPSSAAFHVLHGIESRETYVHRGCVAEIWGAATALLELFPQLEPDLCYQGASFGGGIGAMALPWDPRFRRAHLGVPSFGNHPLRVTLPCVGSGESIRLRYRRDPSILDVLRYFDSATAARHLRTPTLVDCALFDPAVPPPGQFAVYNAIPSEKELFVRQAAHFEYPPRQAMDDAALARRVNEWFDRV